MTGTLSTVVESEVFVRPLRKRDRAVLEKAELFFRVSRNIVIRNFDRAVARRAAQVRADSGLRLPDAVIIATALEERCDALIGNDPAMGRHTFGIPYLHLDDYIS